MNGYLLLDTECGQQKYCGNKENGGTFSFVTCSNKLSISYVTSSNSDVGYRGFNIYYEATVNGNSNY